jgi:Uncharacterised nucleotidyltransferase
VTPDYPTAVALQDSQKLERLAAAGARLRVDGDTAQVLHSLERSGVRALLLKGPSIASWLYADPAERPYFDCDLLISPGDFDAAERELRSLGYVPLLDRWGLPVWWYGHALPWTHPGGMVSVDLHRTLIGAGADHATVWRVLSAAVDEIVVGGCPAPCLSLPARAMHVALHAAQHGPGSQPAVDLERALTLGHNALWLRAASVAAELDATAAFVAGLRLTPAGSQLANRLALPYVRSVTTELRASTPPPLALGFEQLARAPTLQARAEIVWRNLAPGPALLRASDPAATSSRRGLIRAYIRRLVWLIGHAPRGFGAWYRVHRSLRQGRANRC